MSTVCFIADAVLVVHGGVPRKKNATLAMIESIDHRRNVPESPAQYQVSRHLLTVSVELAVQDCIYFDLLWADPQPTRGISHNSDRGGGTVRFGPDISENFMKRNNLSLVIRSVSSSPMQHSVS